MTEQNLVHGRCLCGAVKVTARNAGTHVGACHCESCRRWGGGPFMEVDCGAEVEFDGAEHVKIYHSSDWAERGFCGDCGTHLFYRLKDSGAHMVPVGLLDEDSARVLKTQVFVDEKPPYYSFRETTEMLTGAELFAKYAPPDE